MSDEASGNAAGSRAGFLPGATYGWVIVAIAFLAMALVFGSRFSLGLFLPYMPDALGSTTGAVSGAIAVSMLVAALLQPLTGLYLDRWGGRIVLSIGLGCAGLALCGTALANSLWQVTLLMGLVSSLAYAAVSPVSTTSIVSGWFETGRGAALGVATSGTKVAMIVLPPIIVALIGLLGWRLAMLALGLLVWLLIPAVLILIKPAPAPSGAGVAALQPNPFGPDEPRAVPIDASANSGTLRNALKVPAFWLIAISLFSNGFIMNLVFIHLPSFVLSHGYNDADAAAGLAALGAIGIVGNVVTGALSDRFGRRAVLMIVFAARGIMTLFLILMPGPVAFLSFILVFGLLGYGAIGVIGALASDLFGQRALGTILGSAYVFNQIGAAVGTYIGGVSLEGTGSYNVALWIAAIATVLSFACMAFLRGSADK